MVARFVIADASPLIGLASADAFDLLRELFGRITITDVVRDEVVADGSLPGARQLIEALEDGWVEVVKSPSGPVTLSDLGAGEASVLNLAISSPIPCLVLMDDLLARSHAKAHGLTVTGVAGVLVAAKQRGAIVSVRPFLGALKRNRFRLSVALINAVLGEAGE